MSATDISGLIVVTGAAALAGLAMFALAGIGLWAVRERRNGRSG